MDSTNPERLSQSQPGFVPFAGVAQAGDVDTNGDLVSALTLRLAHAIDVDSPDALAQLEHVRADVARRRTAAHALVTGQVPA